MNRSIDLVFIEHHNRFIDLIFCKLVPKNEQSNSIDSIICSSLGEVEIDGYRFSLISFKFETKQKRQKKKRKIVKKRFVENILLARFHSRVVS